jgi:hypothetical protein
MGITDIPEVTLSNSVEATKLDTPWFHAEHLPKSIRYLGPNRLSSAVHGGSHNLYQLRPKTKCDPTFFEIFFGKLNFHPREIVDLRQSLYSLLCEHWNIRSHVLFKSLLHV